MIKVDGKVRTDARFPAGFMDVIQIEKTNENFRLMYNTKGRFIVQRITPAEAKYKLCKVRGKKSAVRGVPMIYTTDGRAIRYPDPAISINDTVKIDIATGKIKSHVKFDIGNLAITTGGRNLGRVGIVLSLERHPGSYDIVHIKDAAGNTFATRLVNVFIIGRGTRSLVSLPKDKGVKKTIIEERDERIRKKEMYAKKKDV